MRKGPGGGANRARRFYCLLPRRVKSDRLLERISITVVIRTDKQVTGFIVLPKRWAVERTLGWIKLPAAHSRDAVRRVKRGIW